MVKSDSLNILANDNENGSASAESQRLHVSTIYRYMVAPKPHITHVELAVSPESVITSLQTTLPSARFELAQSFPIFFESEQMLAEGELRELADSISTLKENKRTNFYYFTLKDPVARICLNLKRFDAEFNDVIYGSLPGTCSYSVCVKAKYFRFQSTELLTKRHLRSLEKQLMKKIPAFHGIYWQNFEDLFKRLSPKAVARIHEMKTALYSEYDKDIESDFIIKPIY